MADTSIRSTMINPQHVKRSYMLMSFSWRTLLDLSSLLPWAWQQFHGFTLAWSLESSCFTWPACCPGKNLALMLAGSLHVQGARDGQNTVQIKRTLQSSVTLQALRGMGCRQRKSGLSPHGSYWHGSWPRCRGTSESQRCQRHNRSIALSCCHVKGLFRSFLAFAVMRSLQSPFVQPILNF